jgi:hypothetical protein
VCCPATTASPHAKCVPMVMVMVMRIANGRNVPASPWCNPTRNQMPQPGGCSNRAVAHCAALGWPQPVAAKRSRLGTAVAEAVQHAAGSS